MLMPDAQPSELRQLECLHTAAMECQRALCWLHNLSLRLIHLTTEQRRQFSLHQGFIAPVSRVKDRLSQDSGPLRLLRRMSAARVKLEPLTIVLGTVRSASAHHLALEAVLYFVRIWNQIVRP